MTNHAIARSFALLADLLEIQDDNAFKIRAYRRAAEQISGLTENLETIAARGELESIPGIGKGIAGKIVELCAGGTMRIGGSAAAWRPTTIRSAIFVWGTSRRWTSCSRRFWASWRPTDW